MKTRLLIPALLALFTLASTAAPLRIALLEFTDETGARPEASVIGPVNTATLAAKGIDLTAKQLMEQKGFILIDRRDFIEKLQKSTPRELLEGQPRPAYIQAAQLLGASSILRGSLSSFSTRKELYNLEGSKIEMTKLSLRVTLRALDVVDGAVISIAEGVAGQSFRQTASMQTQLGEEDILKLMEDAINQAVPKLAAALLRHGETEQRPKTRLSIDSTDNPALVEIDGVLVGVTPLPGLEVYQGDHTLTVSRPGYTTMSKRILMNNKLQINVPMLRTDLTVEERVRILDKAQLKVYLTNGKPDILVQEIKD
jgi:hypothetical protein